MNWKTYLKKKGARIGAVVLAVVLVLALIAGALGGKAGFLTNLDGIVRAPLQKAATVTAQWLESIYGYIYKYDQLKAENDQLRVQLAEAQAQARALFGSGSDAEAPVVELTADDFMNGTIDLPGILVKCGMVKSKSEGRTAIQQGGVTVDDEKVTDVRTVYTPDDLKDGKLIRKGKKNFKKVVSK